MWPLRAALILLCCAGCWSQDCALTKTFFRSRDFFSVLHWDPVIPVDAPGQTPLYSVKYIHYGGVYEPVSWCQNISTPSCDLTQLMSDVMNNVLVKYHARVFIGDQCVGNAVISPFRQTTLSAPQLSVTSNRTHLNVTVFLPPLPWNRSMDSVTSWGSPIFPRRVPVKNTVHLTQPALLAGKEIQDTSRSVFIWLSDTDVQYCGDVFYAFTHPGSLTRSENTSFCYSVQKTRPQSPNSWLHIIIWPGLAAVLLFVSASVIYCHVSVKKKASLPKALMLSKTNVPQVYSDSWDIISKAEVWTGIFGINLEPQTFFTPPKSEIMSNNAVYASQEPYRNQQDVLIQDSPESSVHYSFILPSQTSDDPPNYKPEESPSELSSVSISSVHSDTEDANRMLFVPVQPDINGTLQFQECFLQCDVDLISPASSGEQTPLLSDVLQASEWHSSGPKPDDGTSSYRQNWVPGLPEEQRTYVMRTETQEEEDGEPDEPRVGVVFLERWMERMQGLSLSCN